MPSTRQKVVAKTGLRHYIDAKIGIVSALSKIDLLRNLSLSKSRIGLATETALQMRQHSFSAILIKPEM